MPVSLEKLDYDARTTVMTTVKMWEMREMVMRDIARKSYRIEYYMIHDVPAVVGLVHKPGDMPSLHSLN